MAKTRTRKARTVAGKRSVSGAHPAKTAKARAAATTTAAKRGAKPKLLRGGNPQIAKATGSEPVQAYLSAVSGWKGEIGRRLDALIMRSAPSAIKAVKWNSPFYGIAGNGWFVSFHTYTNFVKVAFFSGTKLKPVPPGGTGTYGRWIDIHQDDLDEAQMVAWIRQAAALPGWGKS